MIFPTVTRLVAIRLGLFGLLVGMTGCGGSEGLHAVKGKVLLTDGKPLTKGSVRFVPDKDKGNKSVDEPVGEIGSDGSYSLMTAGKKGAAAGWYNVSVTSAEIPDSSKPNAVTSYVAPHFNNPATSKLSVEVVASPGADAYNLKVSAK